MEKENNTNKNFTKILIANRGEIAIRIIKTVHEMGLKAVAIYSEADVNQPHVQLADEAIFIGNSPVTESYLSIENIVNAIRDSGASAVHPGYGFLSENAKFANILKREGVVLIGPSASVIKKMGDKIEAKKIAIDSGVSTVPGYIGVIGSVKQAVDIASDIGFPVMIKAAAGGGGRGMRVVNNANELERAYKSASLEASNCFGDNRLFIEKYISKPRHIEIQIIADQYGNVVCLGERECSLQRYHQKIIEEAPSVFLDDEVRGKMYKECEALAKKVGYFSAGTVEFMMDDEKNYYFLEMNTRLQVEHPVTELITGIDLVREMILVAQGNKLSFSQDDIKLKGHAIETRICAEDPTRNFLPSSGRILEYFEPESKGNIRVDSAVIAGSEVSMFYDPMIAKLCSYGETREEAINYLNEAFNKYIIKGVCHNMSFLQALINNKRFKSGDIHTGFISQEYPGGFTESKMTSDIMDVFLAIVTYVYITERKRDSSLVNQIDDQSHRIGTRWVANIDNKKFPVIIKQLNNGLNIRHSYGRISIRSNWKIGQSLFSAVINGKKINAQIEKITAAYYVNYRGVKIKCYVRSPRVSELESIVPTIQEEENNKIVTAALSGEVVDIYVKEGDKIEVGQELFTLSAMKMDNMIISESKGEVKNILVKKGSSVNSGEVMIEFV